MPESNTDWGADTARFQAFVQRQDDPPAPWRMRARGSKAGILVAVVILAAVLAVVAGFLLAG